MNFQEFFRKQIVAFGLIAAVMSIVAFGQRMQPPTVVTPARSWPTPAASGNTLYCAGYIQQNAIATDGRIIGGDEEADKYNYKEHDFMYISMGSDKGVKVGDMFAVVRPRGKVSSRWTRKSDIGFYVQEVGALEVVRVKRDVAVGKIKSSCDSFLLGDLVQPIQKRTSPMAEKRQVMDIFGEPSGKPQGRVLMSRDGSEMLTRDYIAYVDLGADDHVQVGDRLTVFRPLGKGNIRDYPKKEEVSATDYGFHSDVYAGDKFSNQAGRKSGDKAGGSVVTTERAKHGRPALRKVVGEAVVLNVKERTATVVITRTAAEIHTGDWVEIQ